MFQRQNQPLDSGSPRREGRHLSSLSGVQKSFLFVLQLSILHLAYTTRVVYIHMLTVLLKPKDAEASVSLPVYKMCYL